MNSQEIGRSKTSTSFSWYHYGPLFAILIFGLLTLITVALLGTTTGQNLVEDDGGVQLAGLTMISLASLSAFFLAFGSPENRKPYLLLSYILLIYAMREGDLHKLVSEHERASRFKFYFNSQIPILTRAIVAIAIIAFVIIFIYFLYKYLPVYFRALRSRAPWAIYLIFWSVVFTLSQISDKTPLNHTFLGEVFEETFEAIAEAIMLATIWLFRPRIE